MIPAIGFMVAAYTITRMIDMLGRKEVNIIAKIAAVLAILLTIFCAFVLNSAGQSVGIPGRF